MATRRIRTGNTAARTRAVAEHERARPSSPARGASVHSGQRETRATMLRGGREQGPVYEQAQEEHIGGQVELAQGVHPAEVTVGVGVTRNLGNFESLRLDVRVTLPCHPDDVDDTFAQASDFVAEKLLQEEAAWMGSGATAKAKGGR